jgi:hypothetical protein
VGTAEDPSKRVIEQRLRNRAIEALDWLADGDDSVRVAGGSGYSSGVKQLVGSGWPSRITPVATKALSPMRRRGHFREDIEEDEPSLPG